MLRGAQVLEGCPVTRILVDDGKVQLEEGAWTLGCPKKTKNIFFVMQLNPLIFIG